MSTSEKRLKKLHASPPPTDFRWDEFVAVMREAGFIESCKGGSHYTFQHSNGFTFRMSKTHPQGILKKYQIADAIDALEAAKMNNGDAGNG